VSGAEVEPAAARTFEHFYYKLQAAASGLGVAVGRKPGTHLRDIPATSHPRRSRAF